MKVYYLSVTSFSDVDLGILHHLSNDIQITYGVVIQKNNANYSIEELQRYCITNNIDFNPFIFRYQQKDPRSFWNFYKIIKTIKKSNPDLIYIVSFDHIIFSTLSLLLSKEKTIIALHDVEFHSNAAHKRVLELSRKITMSHFRKFQVFSGIQESIFKRLFPRKKIKTIPLPLKDFGEADKLNDHSEIIRFLFFGNILPYKGLNLLLQALTSIEQANPKTKFELVVAGRCDNWSSHYEHIVKSKSFVKKFIRFIKNEEIAGFFTEADYLILPYLDATQSGPLKIAFNYNVPVIASDLQSFQEEIVHDVDGYLFRSGNADDLTSVLSTVLNNHKNDYLRIKEAQRIYVRSKYSETALKQNFLDLFRSTEF